MGKLGSFDSKNSRASKSFEETISETFNFKQILYFSLAHRKIQVMSKINMQLNQKNALKYSFYLHLYLVLSYSGNIFSINYVLFITLYIYLF